MAKTPGYTKKSAKEYQCDLGTDCKHGGKIAKGEPQKWVSCGAGERGANGNGYFCIHSDEEFTTAMLEGKRTVKPATVGSTTTIKKLDEYKVSDGIYRDDPAFQELMQHLERYGVRPASLKDLVLALNKIFKETEEVDEYLESVQKETREMPVEIEGEIAN